MQPEEVLQRIKGQFAEAVREGEVRDGTVYLQADGARNFEICQAIKEMGFDYLSCLSGVDWKDHFEVVYNVSSLQHPTKIHLRVSTPHDDPRVRTVTPLWATANWHERETWDLLGIRFDGHPDHRRILLPEDWVGHPLRKDYVDQGRYIQFTPYGESKKAASREAHAAETKPEAGAQGGAAATPAEDAAEEKREDAAEEKREDAI